MTKTFRQPLIAIAALATMLAASAAVAQTPAAQTQYEKERAVCLNGKSNQDQATCLKEAAAARDAAKHGQLNDGDAKYKKNATDRCKALSGDEQRDCIARMHGAGTTSGSAAAGGVLRETVTREVGPAVVVQPAATAASAAK